MTPRRAPVGRVFLRWRLPLCLPFHWDTSCSSVRRDGGHHGVAGMPLRFLVLASSFGAAQPRFRDVGSRLRTASTSCHTNLTSSSSTPLGRQAPLGEWLGSFNQGRSFHQAPGTKPCGLGTCAPAASKSSLRFKSSAICPTLLPTKAEELPVRMTLDQRATHPGPRRRLVRVEGGLELPRVHRESPISQRGVEHVLGKQLLSSSTIVLFLRTNPGRLASTKRVKGGPSQVKGSRSFT